MNGPTNTLIGPTAAEVPGHGAVDVSIGRVGIPFQEGHGIHDLSRLAITALGDIIGIPGPLDRMIFGDPFNSSNLLPLGVFYRNLTGPFRLTVDMNGAGPAKRLSAAVLRARQSEVLSDDPEQRDIRTHFNLMVLPLT